MNHQKPMDKEKKRKLLIILLCIGMAICIGIKIWALFFRGGRRHLAGLSSPGT